LGPHRFFCKNNGILELMKNIFKDDWIKVNRQTRQLIEGKFYDYPINATQAFKNIGWRRAIGIGISYFFGILPYKIFGKKINNFHDYIIANFGKKLGSFNMLNYTEKIMGIDCEKIHSDWAEERIKGLNFYEVLKNIFWRDRKNGPKTLIEHFNYPANGIGSICESMVEYFEKKGGEIKLNSFPEKIRHENGQIKTVELNLNGEKNTISVDFLVSSIPPNELIKILDPLPEEKILRAVHNLKWRSQVYLFITLNKKNISGDQWIYLPEKNVPFGRISEMKNFSANMSPNEKTIVVVEYFVDYNDENWNKSQKELTRITIEQAEKLGLFRADEVRSTYLKREKYVYPIYDLDYQSNLKVIREYLDKFKNLFCIGRSGRFQYANQDDVIEMGFLAAALILAEEK